MNIDHALLKELKNAGYPYSHNWTEVTDGESEERSFNFNDNDTSLSELIEDCGEEFGRLIRRVDGSWVAYSVYLRDQSSGATPEEAVARLWLALRRATP